MSAFDPSLYENATFTEPSKRRPPLDVGDYKAVLGKPVPRQWTSSKDPTKSGVAYDIPVTMEVPAEQQVRLGLNTSTLTLTFGVMLDLLPSGMMDMSPGKNNGIRRLREALDLNKPGDTFSFGRDVEGKVVMAKVIQDIYEGEPVDKIQALARA